MTLDEEIAHEYREMRREFLAGNHATAWYAHRRLRSCHSIELIPEIELREPFRFVHPLGSVLGRATYAPGFVVYHGCGVGSDVDGNRPVFTGPCVMFPGSKVLGKTRIGSNVWITANTVVHGRPDANAEIPDNVVVFRNANGLAWKPTTRSVLQRFFSDYTPPAPSREELLCGIDEVRCEP